MNKGTIKINFEEVGLRWKISSQMNGNMLVVDVCEIIDSLKDAVKTSAKKYMDKHDIDPNNKEDLEKLSKLKISDLNE